MNKDVTLNKDISLWEHRCDDNPKINQGWGLSIDKIYLDDEHWYAGNDEYASQIHYCPFCGTYLDDYRWKESENG